MMPTGPRDLPKARVLIVDPPWKFDDKLPGADGIERAEFGPQDFAGV